MRFVPPGAIRIGPIRCIPEVLRACGVDDLGLALQAGVDPHVFDDDDSTIDCRDLGRLLALAVSATGKPHLGLMIAERSHLKLFGPIGMIAFNAPDLGTALRDCMRLMPFYDRASVASIAVEGDMAILSFQLVEPGVAAADQICEGSVAIITHMLRDMCGADFNPDIITFSHRAPMSIAAHLLYFRAPVQYNSATNSICFPARWLETPVGQDIDLERAQLLARAADGASIAPKSTAEQVRRGLHAAMVTGGAGEAEIACGLGVDTSTLRRRLVREGTSFRAIARDVHFETAKRLMRDTDLSLTDIAEALGYADLAILTRAFRRWSGMTPSAWRSGTGEIEG